ncbi:cytochrome-c oxidase, cbb3-type subunit III [Thalassotalea atypica]|uniref:cytochrome-c oxidase, cbb3-type subunit III n=1 Tax=Thalassotalea atypica TaxID=2054316 RepID=UPI0025730535|nr:cytochrome-c oxidase, cbb3-type subunit III [Thalassotalea atypica]
MSSFWSIWISVITLGSLVGCFVLLKWCLRNFAGVDEGEPMDHTFDGIQELNNPLPRWWSIFFLVTIVWGFVYLALYPGLGNFAGLLGWKSSNQDVMTLEDSKAQSLANLQAGSGVLVEYDREVARANEKYGPIFAAYAERDIADLATDEDALKVGQRLFLQNCAQCHGSDARGTTGFPNLTDNDWLYGGSGADIKHSVLAGRKANGMMPWKAALGGDNGVNDVAAYVLSLSGRSASVGDAQAGKEKFAMCIACHGDKGQGSDAMGIALGAPALNDNIWLYGGSEKAVQQSIRNGRAGVMPAWKDILGEEKVHVISAYVYSLSQK